MGYKIAADKKKHFWVGIPLGLILQFFSAWLYPNQLLLSHSVTIIILVAICYGFELFSLITGWGVAENMDAIAGILGGIIGIGLWWGFTAFF